MGSSNTSCCFDFTESMLPRPLIHFQHDVCLALSWFPIIVGVGFAAIQPRRKILLREDVVSSDILGSPQYRKYFPNLLRKEVLFHYEIKCRFRR